MAVDDDAACSDGGHDKVTPASQTAKTPSPNHPAENQHVEQEKPEIVCSFIKVQTCI